ncbi:MAG: AAA family ATPase [Phycisphaerae bacterium]|nr:AAA family ATPase [Phycisphaerae bacterium]
MYAEFFGLAELPFNNTPDPRLFYPTPDHEEALASMIYAVSESKGFMLLTGEAGSGKTLLTRMVLEHFGNRICAATMNYPVASAKELLASVCNEFKVPVPGDADTTTYRRVLHDFLLAERAHAIPVVLMIDEAQALPADGFEQLRMLGNFEDSNSSLLQTLIIGQPELQQLFQNPNMHQLRQRIFRTFHLHPLTREQCQGYIQHRLDVVGAEGARVFQDSAVDVIHDYAQGLPRLINTVCDNAMLSAYSADIQTIDGEFAKSVIAQMLTMRHPGVFGKPQPTPEPVPSTSSMPKSAPLPLQPPTFAPASAPVSVTLPALPDYGKEFGERIRRVESEFGRLTNRIGFLEGQMNQTANSQKQTPAVPTNPQLDELIRKTRDKLLPLQQATDNRLANVIQLLGRGLTPPENTTQAQPPRQPGKPSTSSVSGTGSTGRRSTGLPRPDTGTFPLMPDPKAASAVRDQQLRRLGSIVRQMPQDRKDCKAAVETANTLTGDRLEPGNSNDSNDDTCYLPSPTQTMANASKRLRKLTHQAQTSMDDLRPFISALRATNPKPGSSPPPSAATGFDSPVASLVDEVTRLSNLVDQL